MINSYPSPIPERYACVFPGSGSQYVGMGKSLAEQFPIAKELFTTANEILGYDIATICFKGSITELNRFKNCLLAIYITSVACFEILKQHLPHPPLLLAGHSLGEYSALTSAGALSFEEGLKTVQTRAQLAEKAVTGQLMGMSIIKRVPSLAVETICQQIQNVGYVSVGCYNSLEQVLLTGYEEAIQKAEEQILNAFPDAQIIPLAGSPAFHSPLLEERAQIFKTHLQNCHWKSWKYPTLSNVTAHPYQSKEEAIELLTKQLYMPVQWMAIINYLSSHSISAIIEVGPQTILKQLNPSMRVYSFDDPKDRKILLASYAISR